MNMAKQGLKFEASGNGSAGGLYRMIIDCTSIDACQPELTVVVNGEGVHAGKVRIDAHGMLHVNFHTHLLDNGRNDLEVELRSLDTTWSAISSVEVDNGGRLASAVRDALARHGVPMVFLGDCDQKLYAEAQQSIQAWVEREDAAAEVERKLTCGEVTANEAQMLHSFLRDGFVVMHEKLPDAMVDAANQVIDSAVADGYQGYQMGSSQRLEQMHVNYPAIRDIWLYPPVHRFLSLVFDSKSQPCQSLVYVFGSQQDAHQDTVHLTPFPAGMMCGVWIALEDVRMGAGELAVYPGSHRLPRVYMNSVGAAKVRGDWGEFGEKVVGQWRAMLQECRIAEQPYLAKRGDILIWHENLMHAGRPRVDSALSRRSVVTHNFAKGAIVYYDSSGDVGHVQDAK